MQTFAEKAQALCNRLSCHEIYADEVSALTCEWQNVLQNPSAHRSPAGGLP